MSYNSDSVPSFHASRNNDKPSASGSKDSFNLPSGHCTQRSDSDEGFSEEGLPRFARSKKNSQCSEKPTFNQQRFRSFSPSVRQSGEEILQDLKDRLKREKDMFFNTPDWSINSPSFPKVS